MNNGKTENNNYITYFFGSLGMYMGFIVWCYDGNTDALDKCSSLGEQVKYIYKTLGLKYNPEEKVSYFRHFLVPYHANRLTKEYSWEEYLKEQDPSLLQVIDVE